MIEKEANFKVISIDRISDEPVLVNKTEFSKKLQQRGQTIMLKQKKDSEEPSDKETNEVKFGFSPTTSAPQDERLIAGSGNNSIFGSEQESDCVPNHDLSIYME